MTTAATTATIRVGCHDRASGGPGPTPAASAPPTSRTAATASSVSPRRRGASPKRGVGVDAGIVGEAVTQVGRRRLGRPTSADIPGAQPLFELSVGHRTVPLVSAASIAVVQPLQCVVEAGLDRSPRDVEPASRSRRRSGRGSSAARRPPGGRATESRSHAPMTSRSAVGPAWSPVASATSAEMSVACQRFDRSRLRQVLTRIRSNHGSNRLASRSVSHLRQAWTNASWVASCASAGFVQDRPRQTVGLVEMLVGQPDEGGGAIAAVAGVAHLGRPAVRQLDDLGRSVHDDMTPGRRETFIVLVDRPGVGSKVTESRLLSLTSARRGSVASTAIDINRG